MTPEMPADARADARANARADARTMLVACVRQDVEMLPAERSGVSVAACAREMCCPIVALSNYSSQSRASRDVSFKKTSSRAPRTFQRPHNLLGGERGRNGQDRLPCTNRRRAHFETCFARVRIGDEPVPRSAGEGTCCNAGTCCGAAAVHCLPEPPAQRMDSNGAASDRCVDQ